MSRELQEKAERIIKELEDALIPIKEEINKMKGKSGDSNIIERLR